MARRSRTLALLAVAVSVLWFVAWPAFGGAESLHGFTYRELVTFGWGEASFLLALLVLQPILLAAFFPYLGGRLGSFLTARREELFTRPRRMMASFAVLGGLLALVVALGVVGLRLLNEDEKTYLFQAQMLLQGRLTMPAPAEALGFEQPFLVPVGDQWTAQYPWAHPALLALGLVVGFPWLISAVEVAIAIYFGSLCASELTGDHRIGVASSALMATSPLLVWTGGTLHNANLSVACAAVMLWAVVRLRKVPSWPAAAALGVCLGIGSHNRPLDTLALAIGLALLVGWTERRKLGAAIKRFVPALLFALPLLALHPLINHAISGDYRHNGYWLFNAGHGWITMGFGAGPFGVSHLPKAAAAKMFPVAVRLSFYLTGCPWALLLLALPAFGVSKVPRAWLRAPFVLTAVYLLAYFFYASTCIDTTGPIYYVALVPVLVPCMAAAAVALHDQLRATHGPAVVPGALGCLLLTALVSFWPSQLLELARTAAQSNQCRVLGDALGGKRALVFVIPNTRWPQGWSTWTRFPPLPRPDFSDPVLFARARSPEDDARLVEHYGRDRAPYIAACGWPAEPLMMPYDPASRTAGGKEITPADARAFYFWEIQMGWSKRNRLRAEEPPRSSPDSGPSSEPATPQVREAD